MSASLTQVHMGLGDWELEFDYSQDLWDELERGQHVLIYRGHDLIESLIVLRKSGGERGIVIGGNTALWYMGEEELGPIIRDQRWCSGRSRPSNGGFELGVNDFEGGGSLYWNFESTSAWQFLTGSGARSGNGYAMVAHDLVEDDVLSLEESWEARSGERYRMATYIKRLFSNTDIKGRIRIRSICEGNFKHPNLILNHDFEDGAAEWNNTSVFPADVGVAPDPHNAGKQALRIGPTTRYQPLVNGSFELGLAYWDTSTAQGTWVTNTDQAIDGITSIGTPGGGPAAKYIAADGNPTAPGTNPVLVQLAERWVAEIHLRALDGGSGIDGEAGMTVALFDATFPANTTYMETPRARPEGPGANDWRHYFLDFTIPEGKIAIQPAVAVWDHTLGVWYADLVKLTRVEGNYCTMTQASNFAVTPEREYDVLTLMRSGTGLKRGEVQIKVHYADADGNVFAHEESPRQGTTLNQVFWWRWSFRPPSGAVAAIVSYWGFDIEGGSFWVEELIVQDADKSTHVREAIGPADVADWFALQGEITAPPGTQRLSMEIRAERFSGGWVMDDVSLIRIDEAPTTAQSIVRTLLVDERTGQPLDIGAGSIIGADILLYDLNIRNLNSRAVLHKLCKEGVILPHREYRVDPDPNLAWAGLLSFGRAEELFADRADAVFFDQRGQSLLVLGGPEPEEDSTELATHLTVVGAERTNRAGTRVPIEATVETGTYVLRGWRGYPTIREKVVTDSTADNRDAARAMAEYLLSRQSHPEKTVRITLSDPSSYLEYRMAPGDWIYPYKPESGLEDLDHPGVWTEDGLAFPWRCRMWSQKWNLGPGFRAVLRKANGIQVSLDDFIRWEDSTSIEIMAGDRPAEFTAGGEEGGSPSTQFKRFMASMPR